MIVNEDNVKEEKEKLEEVINVKKGKSIVLSVESILYYYYYYF